MQKGQTALFYASREEHSEDDVKDAVKHLITERRVDVNSKNRVTAFSHFWPISRFLFQKGRTPLLHACALCPHSFVAIQQLIELGADISARDFVLRMFTAGLVSILSFTDKSQCLASCSKSSLPKQVSYRLLD